MWLNKDAVTRAFRTSFFLIFSVDAASCSLDTISESILTQSSLLCKRFWETQPDFFLFFPHGPEIESLLSESLKLGADYMRRAGPQGWLGLPGSRHVCETY